MKKTLFTTAFVVFAFFAAHAQIGAGTLSVGGALQVNSTGGKVKSSSGSADKASTTSIEFGPKVGYFISDNFSVGVGIGLNTSKTESADGNTKNTSNVFGIAPFARYHIPVGEKFYVFGEAALGVGFGGGKTKNGGTSVDHDKISTVGLAVSPGLIFLPSERIAIELSINLLSFNSRTQKDKENSSNKNISNSFSFGPDLFSPQLSVQFYF